MANTQQPTTQNISQAFHNTANGYQDLRTEVDRIPNMPVFDQGTQITQILQQLLNGQQELQNGQQELWGQIRELQIGQQELQDQVGHILDHVGELQNQWVFPILVWYRSSTHSLTRQQRLPMMLYNASASNRAPLCYPAGIPVNNLPATRDDLIDFTGPQLQVAAEVLGLPALPCNALIGQRRAQIAEYIGVSV
ncbi:hypothetical protein L873DRAFT_1793023 [Choiromyces venosus 120613-1]|uniref:Uncharacterized protein n=1 Tax=Choiromyces venosus 120613-1 TaxID=1336337 RepID=A0A3N4JBI1_9PEZI|nr:hypothetical protein L873DRAFT_1793023 [Choiromyces venosus 120613-1]